MVSNYLRDCRYNVGTLKDFIYIIPYETSMIDFEIDNGYANVESVNSDTIYKIEGVNANLTSEETIKGRFRFAATTTINVAEMPSNPLFHQLETLRKGKWYVVVENIHGEQFIQTVEFYTDFTYNYSFTNATGSANTITLTFVSASNIPVLVLNRNIAPTATMISSGNFYKTGMNRKLRMCEYENTYVHKLSDSVFDKIYTTGGATYKEINFVNNSFAFNEEYDGEKFTQTLTFTIPLEQFQFYWHYNLIEFKRNRYAISFATTMGTSIAAGFENGFFPKYTIQTSDSAGTLNTITITLTHVGQETALFNADTLPDDIFADDSTINYKPVSSTVIAGHEVDTISCIDKTTGVYTLIEETTSTGEGLGRYLVLDGYEEVYNHLTIVGTYTMDTTFPFPIKFNSAKCATATNCLWLKTLPTSLNMKIATKVYRLEVQNSCEWKITNSPSWVDLNMYEGEGSTLHELTITVNDTAPDSARGNLVFMVNGQITIVELLLNQKVDWITPLQHDITAEGQTVISYLNDYKDITVVSSEGVETSVGNGQVNMKVPENPNEVKRTFTVELKYNVSGETAVITINQDKIYKKTVATDETICDGNNSYVKMLVYKGYSADNVNILTGTFEKGALVQENDPRCTSLVQEWRPTGESICNGDNEYMTEELYESIDNGLTFTATGQLRTTTLIEEYSPKCNNAYQWIEEGTICEAGNKYKQMVKYKVEGDTMTPMGQIKTGDLVEEYSKDCLGGLTAERIEFEFTTSSADGSTCARLLNVKATTGVFKINWGDGKTDQYSYAAYRNGADICHNYSAAGTYKVMIVGNVDELNILKPTTFNDMVIRNIKTDGYGRLYRLTVGTVETKCEWSSVDISKMTSLTELVIFNNTVSNPTFIPNQKIVYLYMGNGEGMTTNMTTSSLITFIGGLPDYSSNDKKSGIADFCPSITSDGTNLPCTLTSEAIQAANAKGWSINKDCCETEGAKKYQLVPSTQTECVGVDKVQILIKQESVYTNGKWSDWNTIENVQGEVLEYNSPDCGGTGENDGDKIFKWEIDKNDPYTICSGTTEYYAEKKYFSTNGGKTWYAVEPAEYRNSGQIKKTNSENCGAGGETYQERWVVVEGEYMCAVENCTLQSRWLSTGDYVEVNATDSIGYWKTTTTGDIPEICDSEIIKNHSNLFKGCELITSIPQLDYSNSKSLVNMAYGCTSLKTIGNTFNIPNVASIDGMLKNCSSLTGNLTFTNTVNLKSMVGAFENTKLTSINFGGAAPTSIDGFINGSTISEIKNLDFANLNAEYFKNHMASDYLETVHVKNLSGTIDMSVVPNINAESVIYIIENHGNNLVLNFSEIQCENTITNAIINLANENGVGISCDIKILKRWVKQPINEAYQCINKDKYYEYREEQSVDDGITWTPTGNTRTGELYEYDSADCGGSGGSGGDTPQITYNNWVANGSDVLVYNDGFTINNLGPHDDGLYHFTIEGAGTRLRFDYNIIYSHYVDLTNMTDLGHLYLGNTFYTGGDFSGWNTSNVTNMCYLFDGSTYLKTLNLSSFDTSNVTDMSFMFNGCSSLKALDLSSFNTSKVTTMNSMFHNCSSLTALNLSSFNTQNLTDMNYLFDGCSSLKTLDLSSFNTQNLTDMSRMFGTCTSLKELNISGWDLSKLYNNDSDYNMFYDCTSLQTIYAYNCNEATIGLINNELSYRGLTGQVTIITQ